MTKQEWRAAREIAFKNGKYIMTVPAVTTGRWDIVSWCNHVQFSDEALRGFDDRKGETQWFRMP